MSTVVITGCSTGIGRATALAFARQGDRVYATMRAPQRGADLDKVIAQEGLDAAIIALDVTDDTSVRAVIADIGDRGPLDVVVNNAGVGPFAPVERTTDEHWLQTFDTNLFGAVRVARAALPIMRAQGGGTIVNISSLAARAAPVPTQSVYTASKHALCTFTDALNAECSGFGINAYCIEPGFFATAIMDKDLVAQLGDDDPYKPASDMIQQFFRAGLASAPPPDGVANLVVAAARGTLEGGAHHPIGVPGLGPTSTSARMT